MLFSANTLSRLALLNQSRITNYLCKTHLIERSVKSLSTASRTSVNANISFLKSEKLFKYSVLNGKNVIPTLSFNKMFTNKNDPTKTEPKNDLSSDLQNIMSKRVATNQDAEIKSEQTTGSNEESQEPKGKLASMFSKEHAWKFSLGMFTFMFVGSFVYILVNWGAPDVDDYQQPIRDQYSDLPLIIQYPKRALNAVFNYYELVKNPSTEKLLPEPIQPPYYQPPYTLVIEMTGILLHPEWTFQTGWRYRKRPGMDYFIDQIKYPMFEVVLFTKEPFLSGAPIVASLDPENKIQFKLFRESTKFVDNNFVKDMSFMNRDPSKIIIIDCDKNAYSLQPRNALHRLKKWEGDEKDTDLVYLASFLKMIANSNVADVRDVLDYYNGETDPLETFKINQAKLQEAEYKRKQELEEIKEQKKKSSSSFSLFNR